MNAILFIASAACLLLVSITMLARANDLRWRKGLLWNVRLIGFILAGCAPLGMVAVELMFLETPNIYEVIFRVGIAAVFMTTPYLPPWWKWISGWGFKGGDYRPEWAERTPGREEVS